MIASSRLMQGAAMMLALGLHVLATLSIDWQTGPKIAGAGTPQEVALGNAFADMATGVLTPQTTDDMTQPIAPPTATQAVQTASTTHAATPTQNPARTVSPENAAVIAARPMTTAVIAAPTATATATPVTPTQVATQPPIETVQGQDGATTAPERSPRPIMRPERLAPAPRAARPSQPQGNAPRNAQAGARTTAPQDTGAAASGSNATTTQSTVASNAAVANYGGQVMRRIARVRQPVSNTRGAASVIFVIAANGGLANVTLARSSGNAELDAAALRVIQRAAPFPPPPRGAQTRFQIEIKGR